MNIKKWIYTKFFKKDVERQAYNIVLSDAIDVLTRNIGLSRQDLTDITSIHYSAQLYDLFINNPFLVTIIVETKNNKSVVDISKSWMEELGWTKKEIDEHKLYGLVHPDDYDETLNAHNDISSITSNKMHYNRYEVKYPTKDSFEYNGKHYVWLAWVISNRYEKNDKYRVGLAKIIRKYDPLFKELQNYELEKKRSTERSATQKPTLQDNEAG